MRSRLSSVVRFALSAGIVVLLMSVMGCGERRIPIPPYTSPPNLSVSPNAKLQSVGFDRLEFDLELGDVIGARYSEYAELETAYCNWRNVGKQHFRGGRQLAGDYYDDFQKAFYDALNHEGYPVVGDPSRMYGKQDEIGKASFVVSGRIVDLTQNLCIYHELFTGRYLGGRGEAETDVWIEWSVYDPVAKEVVLKVKTRGYQGVDQSSQDPGVVSLLHAFYGAAQELANNQKFYDVVSKKPEYFRLAESKAETVGNGKEGTIVIPFVPPSRESLTVDPERFQKSTVIIRTTGSHGSGFVVSRNGLILTNAHVVGDNEKVSVEFYGGFEMQGTVLRRHKTRDAALVKVDVSKALPLAVRRDKLKVTDIVYAIGAPKSLDFGWSVTRGVVSSFRKNKKTGLRRIQADVEIHGGNSGGPLLDENGNVAAICVESYTDSVNGFGQGLNLFIPIHDALKKLDIKIGEDSGAIEYAPDGGIF